MGIWLLNELTHNLVATPESNTIKDYFCGTKNSGIYMMNNQVHHILCLRNHFVSSYFFSSLYSFNFHFLDVAFLLEINRYLVSSSTNGNIFLFLCSDGQLDLNTRFKQASWEISIYQLS